MSPNYLYGHPYSLATPSTIVSSEATNAPAAEAELVVLGDADLVSHNLQEHIGQECNGCR